METAETFALETMLSPASVAVIGVSSRPESLSGRLLANLIGRGFRGRIYPINPRAAEIQSLRCYPRLRDVPEQVDLAIVMVPRDAVLDTADECLDAGVGGIVVITAGFREAGDAGAVVEAELLERLRGRGVRMIGPNCMGLINTAPEVGLDATFSPVAARPGHVAYASHSGALGVAVLEAAREVGLAFSQFVSLGNSSDVTVCDVLEAWERDEATRVIMLYLEALDEPRRFLDVTTRITAHRPVVALKAGRTAAGQRAASSHTGALAAEDSNVDAVLRQAGVLRAPTLDVLYDWVAALQSQPLPRGRRVAIVTNAGGPAIAAADALAREGLRLAELDAETTAALRSFLPPEAAVGNPVDMLPSALPDHYARALDLVLADGAVDAAVVITVTPILVAPIDIARAIAARPHGDGKPVLTVFMTAPEFYMAAREVDDLPPVYRFPEPAVGALAAMARQAERQRRATSAQAEPVLVPSATLTAAVRDGAGFIAPSAAFACLAEAGVPVAPFRLADAGGTVATAARELGFPVVLKAFGAGLVHKTDAGAVAVGLRDEAELGAALAEMTRRLAAQGVSAEGFLVQRHVTGGRELIVGVTRQPGFGPVVMCGVGGVAVEAFRDVSFRLAPFGPDEAGAMLDELRGARLLTAFRGQRAADRAAVVRALVAVSALAAANPAIAELDVNPLLVLDEGKGCVAVDVRIRLGT
jgi:acetyl coenzyme A synthetase (ADP forming)-like protein